jgi:hypothetical protein
LETDVLVEKVHKANEKCIAEIDKYEKECVDNITTNFDKTDNESNRFISNLDEFILDSTVYLANNNIAEDVVDKLVDKANSITKRFKVNERILKNVQFNGKIAEFTQSQLKLHEGLIGLLVYKPVNSEFLFLKEMILNKKLLIEYSNFINLLKFEHGKNFAFYVARSAQLNMICFDDDGNAIKQSLNTLMFNSAITWQVKELKVAQLSNKFFLTVCLHRTNEIETGAICGHQIINNQRRFQNLLFIVDQNFNYINHKFYKNSNEPFLHITANSSRVLCVDSLNAFFYLDMNLDVLSDKPLNAIKTQVDQTAIDFQMNDQFIFVLCSSVSDKKLNIFDIDGGHLVKEIETNASHIKLVSSDYIVLFDHFGRELQMYDQSGEFSKLDHVDLKKSIKTEMRINKDKSNTLVFYDHQYMKYLSLV